MAGGGGWGVYMLGGLSSTSIFIERYVAVKAKKNSGKMGGGGGERGGG